MNGLQPWLAPWGDWLLRVASNAGFQVRVTSTFRTAGQQARLYRNWLAGRSPYPAAPPGTSFHEYGRAFDLEAGADALSYLGSVWQSVGGTWGGPGGDPIHFQA